MLERIKKLLSGLNPFNIPQEVLQSEKLTIIDVRSTGEFSSGHIEGSINIPLQQLEQKLKMLNGKSPIVVCCASGMRSASALTLLRQKGFDAVYNGGGWTELLKKIKEVKK